MQYFLAACHFARLSHGLTRDIYDAIDDALFARYALSMRMAEMRLIGHGAQPDDTAIFLEGQEMPPLLAACRCYRYYSMEPYVSIGAISIDKMRRDDISGIGEHAALPRFYALKPLRQAWLPS